MAFRLRCLREGLTAHWELSDNLHAHFGCLAEAIRAASLVKSINVAEEQEFRDQLRLANWARHAPPPGTERIRPQPGAIMADKLESFKLWLYDATEETADVATFGFADQRFAIAVARAEAQATAMQAAQEEADTSGDCLLSQIEELPKPSEKHTNLDIFEVPKECTRTDADYEATFGFANQPFAIAVAKTESDEIQEADHNPLLCCKCQGSMARHRAKRNEYICDDCDILVEQSDWLLYCARCDRARCQTCSLLGSSDHDLLRLHDLHGFGDDLLTDKSSLHYKKPPEKLEATMRRLRRLNSRREMTSLSMHSSAEGAL